MKIEVGRFEARLADQAAEVEAALRLRHRVFVEEMGAHSDSAAAGIEQDRFDAHCQHLILLDRDREPAEAVVGAYRLLAGEAALAGPGFYSAGEFDLGPLEARAGTCLEVGRTCVEKSYRGGPAGQILWAGLAQYVFANQVELLFGCASYPGTDADALAQPLALLHHFHLAPAEIRARARSGCRVEMNRLPKDRVDKTVALQATPSLIRGYLRLGGFAGDGAWADHAFGVIDVLLVVDVLRASEETRSFYRDRLVSSLARVVD